MKYFPPDTEYCSKTSAFYKMKDGVKISKLRKGYHNIKRTSYNYFLDSTLIEFF